jgi:hypothetical protein
LIVLRIGDAMSKTQRTHKEEAGESLLVIRRGEGGVFKRPTEGKEDEANPGEKGFTEETLCCAKGPEG